MPDRLQTLIANIERNPIPAFFEFDGLENTIARLEKQRCQYAVILSTSRIQINRHLSGNIGPKSFDRCERQSLR